MEKYDLVVIGSGSGMVVVEEALSHGLKVALVDKGPTGGTCLNTGCIPSKMLIYAADRIIEATRGKKAGHSRGDKKYRLQLYYGTHEKEYRRLPGQNEKRACRSRKFRLL